ncbi:hypothetical protein Phpb_00834 [Photorhabdus namnaonensis]|uniref:Uncharacterized protein n=1 Tax=Photorhabdus namnaonensis TaxID=1851568 RepID=A0A1B8YMH8_9GAMM|nr:hypothetical protein Phpb_00834 [Photorhabdus namnaonensis]
MLKNFGTDFSIIDFTDYNQDDWLEDTPLLVIY